MILPNGAGLLAYSWTYTVETANFVTYAEWIGL